MGKNWDTIEPVGTAEPAIVAVLVIVVGWLLVMRRKRRSTS